jgi:hypothetical protein
MNLSLNMPTAPPPPKTITREWEEAANERAKEMNLNPISGKGYLSEVLSAGSNLSIRYLVGRLQRQGLRYQIDYTLVHAPVGPYNQLQPNGVFSISYAAPGRVILATRHLKDYLSAWSMQYTLCRCKQ